MTHLRTSPVPSDVTSKRLALGMVMCLFGFLFLQASQTFSVANAVQPPVFLTDAASPLAGAAWCHAPLETTDDDPLALEWLDDTEDDDTPDAEGIHHSTTQAIPTALSPILGTPDHALTRMGGVPLYILYCQRKSDLA